MILSLLAYSSIRLQTPESLTIQPPVVAEIVGSEGSMKVKWSVPCDSVDVAFGETVDRFGSSKKVRGADSMEDPGLPFARVRFHGGPMDGRTLIVGKRFEGFAGATNFRDLGGYATASGKVTKYGLMFRANALARMSDSELTQVQKLGVAADYDLRGDAEVKAAPDHMPASIKYVRLPIEGRLSPHLIQDPSRSYGETMLGAGYVQMVDERGPTVFGPWLKELAAGLKPEKFVIHCSAGKDRTGVSSAILLSLLGVPRDTIIADYSLTNNTFADLNRTFLTVKTIPLPPGMNRDDMKQLLFAYPGSIKQALDHIDSKYGSVEAYALGPCGLTKNDLDKLRKNYLQ